MSQNNMLPPTPRFRPMVLASALLIVAALLAQPLGSHSSAAGARNLHPVVLMPGYASNKLEAMLTPAYKPPTPACVGVANQTGWFQLWPNHTAMHDASQVPCFAYQFSLVYDAGADDYRNTVGVATRAPFFGSVRSVIQWDKLVQQLEGMGYRDGVTLYAAPYDFRYAVAPPGHPSAVGDRYFRDLEHLIQSSHDLNQGRPAIMVAHSFGCALTYQFLLSRPLAWRRRYVKHVILLAPALGGFAMGMNALSAGMDYGLPNVTRPTRLRLARSQQSTLWRLPTPLVFGDRPLVVTRTATYSARNMSKFLEAIGFAEGVRPYLTRVLPMWEALPAPMVPVTNFIGFGVRTPETYVFGTDGLEGEAKVLYGDGDGDINMVSLAAVEKWSAVRGQVSKVLRLLGVNHNGFLSNDFAVKSILAEILEAGERV